MSATPKPRSKRTHGTRKPAAKQGRRTKTAPLHGAEPEPARLRRLVAEGVVTPPSSPGIVKEVLRPGPRCPGAGKAVVESRGRA